MVALLIVPFAAVVRSQLTVSSFCNPRVVPIVNPIMNTERTTGELEAEMKEVIDDPENDEDEEEESQIWTIKENKVSISSFYFTT